MTFLLTNYAAGDPRLEAALEWEKVFIDFMKRWTASEMPASDVDTKTQTDGEISQHYLIN